MAAITATNAKITGGTGATEVTLDGVADTFIYAANKGATLLLRNPTAGALTPVIAGDGATVVGVPGVGTVDISGGFSVGAIAAGAAHVVRLDTVREYLAGTITITGGTGLIAVLLEF